MRIQALIAAFTVLCISAFPAPAADETGKPGQEAGRMLAPEASDIEEFRLIHADSMTLTRQQGEPQILKGSVDIVLIDKDKRETRIKAEKMTIHYKQDLKKVQRIEAEKRVKIDRLGTSATTELAVYQGDKNIIELLADPYVKDSRGELSADKITIFVDSDKVVAEGNVRGTIHPEALERTSAK